MKKYYSFWFYESVTLNLSLFERFTIPTNLEVEGALHELRPSFVELPN